MRVAEEDIANGACHALYNFCVSGDLVFLENTIRKPRYLDIKIEAEGTRPLKAKMQSNDPQTSKRNYWLESATPDASLRIDCFIGFRLVLVTIQPRGPFSGAAHAIPSSVCDSTR